jgi:hypothetical protein
MHAYVSAEVMDFVSSTRESFSAKWHEGVLFPGPNLTASDQVGLPPGLHEREIESTDFVA